jgi:hypothetical protein
MARRLSPESRWEKGPGRSGARGPHTFRVIRSSGRPHTVRYFSITTLRVKTRSFQESRQKYTPLATVLPFSSRPVHVTE